MARDRVLRTPERREVRTRDAIAYAIEQLIGDTRHDEAVSKLISMRKEAWRNPTFAALLADLDHLWETEEVEV